MTGLPSSASAHRESQWGSWETSSWDSSQPLPPRGCERSTLSYPRCIEDVCERKWRVPSTDIGGPSLPALGQGCGAALLSPALGVSSAIATASPGTWMPFLPAPFSDTRSAFPESKSPPASPAAAPSLHMYSSSLLRTHLPCTGDRMGTLAPAKRRSSDCSCLMGAMAEWGEGILKARKVAVLSHFLPPSRS